ncbi:hypothetical protein CANCADRAFT_65271 [Tortispora caseinolytica NRRL Y-17796]|uniref:Inositol hexakisphosphate and diphosphoinositol-pentakisphosphate kinase n=1 Tax=Tortispora caseinolytica NRRL Y-17796 TaxID=767744 RepID=A0A1E4TI08_9ASCO|nr:hypothetical protein CANCADRAFT_65271 [Tortispora caseinolytica NRRL Y-17796]
MNTDQKHTDSVEDAFQPPKTATSRIALPKIGTIGVCAMDSKARSKPCRHILSRLVSAGEFDTVIFGDKVILDEDIENWPTCDFLICFFSNGFPLDKAIAYVELRKPFLINDLVSQKILWDRRLVLYVLDSVKVPTPKRLEISRDGGPRADGALKTVLSDKGIHLNYVSEPEWSMPDEDTLQVEGKILKKPFVEKPVDGEDHNIYIYYPQSAGGGGRKLFRKVGNKSSDFDPSLSRVRAGGSYIYEEFMDTDNAEDVKAYTVGPNFCHAETRKSPVVDGVVKRNTFGKEVRFVTKLTEEEFIMARNVSSAFKQTICGFDLLRVRGKSYVIDVNGFSFVKDNDYYYESCSRILREMFVDYMIKSRKIPKLMSSPSKSDPKGHRWTLKGFISVIRHADRTPKQKIKFSFKSPIFVDLLMGHKEEVIMREPFHLRKVLETTRKALELNAEDPNKLKLLAYTLEKKLNLAGTKVQIKPVINAEGVVEKIQFNLKWGGEPTHSARYQAQDLGDQTRKDVFLLNRSILDKVSIFTSSERRVITSAEIWGAAFMDVESLPPGFLQVRKDLLDDSNAAKDLMDKVKKKLKPLLRKGVEPPPNFTWPEEMPEPSVVMQRVVDLMNFHKKVMEKSYETTDVNSFQQRWCCAEDPVLFRERWDKLFDEFSTVEKSDPSKISELYDTMKFDALHNRAFLENIFMPDPSIVFETDSSEFSLNIPTVNTVSSISSSSVSLSNNSHTAVNTSSTGSSSASQFTQRSAPASSNNTSILFNDPRLARLRELYRLVKVLFDFICPQEYGIEDNEKLDIGLLTSMPLMSRIIEDLERLVNAEEGECVAYFTKESHIYTLLNIIFESHVPTKTARNALPELDYLTQICFELYESTLNEGKEKKYAVRISLSPGCHSSDPLDLQLDSKHTISCIPRRALTSYLDMDTILEKVYNKFSRVNLPKRFIPVNITSDNSNSQSA